MRVRPTFVMATVLGTILSTAQLASAHTFGASSMETWSGCNAPCNAPASLSYTHDQMDYFTSRMQAYGNSLDFRLHDSSVWASDVMEDKDFGGEDRYYADYVDVFAYSGHGDCPANTWGQTFVVPTCATASAFATYYPSCYFDSEYARLGENAGAYSTPAAGNMRFAMWATCRSVDAHPDQQWGQSFWNGGDFIMGYYDTSADSYTTDEVPGDWVTNAYGSGWTLKSAWFDAVDDWWVDDTGSVFSSGVDASNAAARRDNMSVSYPKRLVGVTTYAYAWAYHEG